MAFSFKQPTPLGGSASQPYGINGGWSAGKTTNTLSGYDQANIVAGVPHQPSNSAELMRGGSSIRMSLPSVGSTLTGSPATNPGILGGLTPKPQPAAPSASKMVSVEAGGGRANPYGAGYSSASDQMATAMAENAKRLAHLESQFKQRVNPYDQNYSNQVFTRGALGGIQRKFTDEAQATRDALGARGVAQARPGGQETQAFDALAYRKQQALGDAAASADLRTNELRAGWDQEQARALDQFELNRALGLTSAAEAALRGDRFAALTPAALAAAGLENDISRQRYDQGRELFPGELQKQQYANQLLGIEANGAQNDFNWRRDNPLLAGGMDFMEGGGGRLIGGVAGGLLFGPPGAAIGAGALGGTGRNTEPYGVSRIISNNGGSFAPSGYYM